MQKNIQKVFRRSKKKFATSRAAWIDIAKKTKSSAKKFKSSHTKEAWIWKRK